MTECDTRGIAAVDDDNDLVRLERMSIDDSQYAALLTLHRPEALNPVDQPMMAALNQRLDELEHDSAARILLITGSGRAFSAGGDLKKYRTLQRDHVGYPVMVAHNLRVFTRLRAFPKPVVALVNGVAAAGGIDLMLHCDFAYAAESARIGDVHLRYGQMGGAGSLTHLPRAIGSARARELVFGYELLTAQDANLLGLVNKVFPDDELIEAGLTFARRVAATSPLALAQAKEVMNRGEDAGLGATAHLQLEAEQSMRYVLLADDAVEGLTAFSEKRVPRFGGR